MSDAIRFNQEGTYNVTIKDAVVTDKVYNPAPGKFDICLLCEAVIDGQVYQDWWKGGYSNEYAINSSETWAQITLNNLKKIGFNGDFSQLPALAGVQTVVSVVASKCGKYMNLKYLGGSSAFTPEAVNLGSVAAQLNAMAQPAQQAAPAFSQPAPAAAPQMQQAPQAQAAPAMPQQAPIQQAPAMPAMPQMPAQQQAPAMPQAPQ